MTRLAGSRLLIAAAAAVLGLSGCAPRPSVMASAVPPVPPGQARIWFYRDYEPSVSLNVANVSLNGVDGIHVGPDGAASYRDVPPGRYHITVESVGRDVNQSKDVALAPGQQAFAKIVALSSWEAGGDLHGYHRDTFYVWLIPPDEAIAAIAGHPFAGPL